MIFEWDHSKIVSIVIEKKKNSSSSTSNNGTIGYKSMRIALVLHSGNEKNFLTKWWWCMLALTVLTFIITHLSLSLSVFFSHFSFIIIKQKIFCLSTNDSNCGMQMWYPGVGLNDLFPLQTSSSLYRIVMARFASSRVCVLIRFYPIEIYIF